MVILRKRRKEGRKEGNLEELRNSTFRDVVAAAGNSETFTVPVPTGIGIQTAGQTEGRLAKIAERGWDDEK